MSRYIIDGGVPLYGTVRVSGSKNAALPILFASIATCGISKIYNLPNIGDTAEAVAVLRELGAVITYEGSAVYIDTRELKYSLPSPDRVAKLRASTYLIGACLSRFGRAEVQSFGGCNFSSRPIDMHISAAEAFGAVLKGTSFTMKSSQPADIKLKKKSVGATVNALIMAASTDGVSSIENFAEEPHILSLIKYLRSAGAGIVKDGNRLIVKGGRLHGGTATVPGDMIEAGTFLCASLVSGGWVRVTGFDTSELESFLSVLSESGVGVNLSGGGVSLFGTPDRSLSVTTAAYPGFPTDLQPIAATVMAKFKGGSIRDDVWTDRFGYLDTLAEMGLSYEKIGNYAKIDPSKIHSGNIRTPDLRGGAAAVLMALSANGESIIEHAETVKRGYENLENKLKLLGAKIIYSE